MRCSVLLAVFFAAVFAAPDPALLEVAIQSCTRNPDLVRQLFEIEAAEGLPPGLIAAAALRESSCRPEIHCGDNGASCGLLQLSGAHRKGTDAVYRELYQRNPESIDTRRDVATAATYWSRRVKRGKVKAERDCRGRGGYRTRADFIWASANLTATWRPNCSRSKCVERAHDGACQRKVCTRIAARCARMGRYETKHFATLRKFRRLARLRHSARGDDAGDVAAARATQRKAGTPKPSE
jgi:hypothetical protein